MLSLLTRKVILAATLALGLMFGLTLCVSADGTIPIRIGVLAYRGQEHALKHWGPHADYLNAQLAPRRFEIVPMSYAALTSAVQRREIQFVITNTGHYTEMELAGGVSRIATRLMASPIGPLDRFGGTVITRADNIHLNRYADLKGKQLMVPDKSSLGGWQVHLREAIEQGINLEKDARTIIETKNHEKVVEGVLAGQADAGFVRSDLVESMAAEGRIRLTDLHIVNQRQAAGYPYLLSTRLYPEWPLARVAGVPDQLAKDVLIRLLALAPEHPAAKAAGIHGWTLPQNYQSVHDLFREARLGPYANLPITLDDILTRYGQPLAAFILIAFLGLGGLAWYISGVNVSLKREIRRRIEAEHSLEESDSRFRAMADALPSLIWQAGPDKLCTFFNRSWLAFTGRSLAQEMGNGWVEGVHTDDLERCLNTYTDAFDARQAFEMKYRLRHASGEYRWIVDIGTPIHGPDGEFRGYFGHCLDITEIQHLNEALASGRERYALAQRAAHIVTLDWDIESDRLQWSEEIEPLLGFAPGGFAHTYEAFLECVHPDDRAAVEQAVKAARKRGRSYHIEHRIVRPNGSVRWVLETGDVVRDAGNKAVRMIGIVQDITDRKRAEEALRQSHEQLTASLATLQIHTRDLTQVNEMNELLQTCLKEEEIHRVFGHMAHTLELGSGGLLAMHRPPGQGLQTVANWGHTEGMDMVFDPDDCWGLRRGQSYEPTLTTPRLYCAHFRPDPGMLNLCHPLVVQGETMGLISVRAPADIGDTAWLRIRQLSVTLGEALKLALSNIRLREALREQATRDPLTGLFNRRYLDETLPRELHACQRDDQPLALAMLDIDHFKQYNDTWGHEAGDLVLIEVSRILREHLRASDIACRYGGEELVAVMPRAELHEARERISRIANLVRNVELHIHDRPLPAVTFSAGIALAPRHGETADILLRAADQALYAAKQEGRDRVFTVGEAG
jgi:diguanylate cyclase (GGDEF)-like protein/PAS domain S-box-containing protein